MTKETLISSFEEKHRELELALQGYAIIHGDEFSCLE